MKPIYWLLVAMALVVAGCATTVQEERESLLAEPINCEVAEEDIAALEAVKPSRRERARSAMQTATPLGALTSVVQGSYRDRASVLLGRTDEELDARIAEIEQNCGVSASDYADT